MRSATADRTCDAPRSPGGRFSFLKNSAGRPRCSASLEASMAQQEPTPVTVGPHHLQGLLGMPTKPGGVVIFAHGSGSGRFSPRNNYVARRLEQASFATLLLDLLSPEEESDRRNVFDIEL